jgi:chromosome segregation ATPase
MIAISKERVEAAKQMVAAGQANQNSLQDAMEKLTRANIELAQRREQIGVSAGAERINELLKRMSDISLQATKGQIQLDRLNQRIKEAEKQLDKSVDYELLSMRLELAKEKLRESLRRAESMKDYQPEPPLVTPIGAD